MKKNRLLFLLSIVIPLIFLSACKKQDNWQSAPEKTLKAVQVLSYGDVLKPEFLQMHQAGDLIKVALLRPMHSTFMGFSYSLAGSGYWHSFYNYTHPANGGLSYNEGTIDDGTSRLLETYEMPVPNYNTAYDIKAEYMIMDHANNATIYDSTIYRGLQIGPMPPPGSNNPGYKATLYFIMNFSSQDAGYNGSMSVTIEVNEVVKLSDTITYGDFNGQNHLQKIYSFVSDYPEGRVSVTINKGGMNASTWNSMFFGSSTLSVVF